MAMALLALAGCGVGEGTGMVKGPLTILDCGGAGKTFPNPDDPQEFDMQPGFFAAEQLLDLSPGEDKAHRLIIRLQTTGRRRELNDILRFDIPNLQAVARCFRAGAMAADGGAPAAFDQANCFPSAGGTRIRVGENALIRAAITPNLSCSTKYVLYNHVGTAVSGVRTPNDGNWESYIVFTTLGRALNSDFGPDFKIEIDDQLKSSEFSLTIEDDAVVAAQTDPLMPTFPISHIHGKLTGNFDFDMQRGQGAQTFP
jgi:hypothetical protein